MTVRELKLLLGGSRISDDALVVVPRCDHRYYQAKPQMDKAELSEGRELHEYYGKKYATSGCTVIDVLVFE